MAEAAALSATIELDLAWEFAPSDEFSFQELAQEYFSENATLAQQTAALISLFQAPHYFRRSGKGKFKKASADVLQQALAAIEKKNSYNNK
jgi:exoribonuclease II